MFFLEGNILAWGSVSIGESTQMEIFNMWIVQIYLIIGQTQRTHKSQAQARLVHISLDLNKDKWQQCGARFKSQVHFNPALRGLFKILAHGCGFGIHTEFGQLIFGYFDNILWPRSINWLGN